MYLRLGPRTSPDPGGGNHERSGPIIDRHQARKTGMSYRQILYRVHGGDPRSRRGSETGIPSGFWTVNDDPLGGGMGEGKRCSGKW